MHAASRGNCSLHSALLVQDAVMTCKLHLLRLVYGSAFNCSRFTHRPMTASAFPASQLDPAEIKEFEFLGVVLIYQAVSHTMAIVQYRGLMLSSME